MRGSGLVLTALAMACSGEPVPSPTDVPTSAPTATPSPTAAAATADEVFDRVAPSLAFISTDAAQGSALVVGRHAVTNAHVVRPYRGARVVLADGTIIAEAPVIGWDLIADLVVLDIGSRPARPILAASDRPAKTGERVYLVGYPLADRASPTATITEGIISGAAVEWTDALTFHQTDAVIEDGQSGGVLVDRDGALLGITGGSRGRFAVALDAEDALARVERLRAGVDVDATGDHLLPVAGPGGDTSVEAVIRHRADVHVWVFPGKTGDPPVTISLTSDRPVGLYGMAAAGQLGHGAGPPGVKLDLSIPFEATGPYAVKVEPIDAQEVTVSLRSSVGLTAFADDDDGRPVRVGDSVIGAADYAGDLDWYPLKLVKGDRVEVRASAAALDPALFIDRAGDPTPLAAGHDDGGPLGGDDTVEFTAPADGEYLVVVADPRFQGAGAYILTVERA